MFSGVPPPWAVLQNQDRFREETRAFLFKDGCMKPVFETAITVLGFGWVPVNNDLAWNLPGMRWSKDLNEAVHYCATAGTICWHIVSCQKTGIFQEFAMNFKEYLPVYARLLKMFKEMFSNDPRFADRVMMLIQLRDTCLPGFPQNSFEPLPMDAFAYAGIKYQYQ
jgi:hypothetical protein